MTQTSTFETGNDLFSGLQSGPLAVIHLKQGLLLHVADLRLKDALFEFLDRVAKSESVKAVLIFGASNKAGTKEYIEFYNRILGTGRDLNNLERLYNAVNQFILKLRRLDKFVVHADSGATLSLFMNVSLACDYRLVADNTTFVNAYLKLGLIPKGGGVFFLSRLLGENKAYEVLMSESPLSAEAAFKLGIVDKIVPANMLEESATELAMEFAQKPGLTLMGIKRLVNDNHNALQDHLEHENEVLRLIIRTAEFREKLAAHSEN